jgi:hypothetical protein
MPDGCIEKRSGDEVVLPGVGERCRRARHVEIHQELLTLGRIDIGPSDLRQRTLEILRIRLGSLQPELPQHAPIGWISHRNASLNLLLRHPHVLRYRSRARDDLAPFLRRSEFATVGQRHPLDLPQYTAERLLDIRVDGPLLMVQYLVLVQQEVYLS